MRLTKTIVENIKPNPDEKQWISDDGTKGLKLYIGKTGVKIWYFNHRDASGKKAFRKLGDAQYLTFAQARQMVRDLGGKVARGEDIRKEKKSDKLTLGAYLNDHYFPHIRQELKGAKEYIRAITVAFGDCFKNPIEEITPILVDKWRSKCRESGLKAASINRTTAYLKAAFNYGVKSGLIEKNPIARISQLNERDSKQVVRYLSEDERERLETALVEREERIRNSRESGNEWRRERGYKTKPDITGEFADYLRPAVLLSLTTGIRRGALFALKWGDIDFPARTVTLRAENAKNSKTARINLNDDAIYILSSWREQSQRTGKNDLIFPSAKTGGRMQEIKTAWKNVLEDAEISDFRWHDMRHDFASQLVMRGVDLNTVRELLCHSDLKMTMKYAHLSPESKLNAAQVLNRYTNNKVVNLRKIAG